MGEGYPFTRVYPAATVDHRNTSGAGPSRFHREHTWSSFREALDDAADAPGSPHDVAAGRLERGGLLGSNSAAGHRRGAHPRGIHRHARARRACRSHAARPTAPGGSVLVGGRGSWRPGRLGLLQYDAKTNTVTFRLVAGPFQFNGYGNGGATLTVPPGNDQRLELRAGRRHAAQRGGGQRHRAAAQLRRRSRDSARLHQQGGRRPRARRHGRHPLYGSGQRHLPDHLRGPGPRPVGDVDLVEGGPGGEGSRASGPRSR